MRQPIFHVFLWLLPALTAATREMVRLQPNPGVSAACGQSVTLKCDVVSSLDKLSIKHMAWSLNQKTLCSVDAHENFTSHPGSEIRYFHCEYVRGRLWLVLPEVRPREAANLDFMCKLKSNRGAKHIHTRVELQECCAPGVRTHGTHGTSTCTFYQVHEGRDVHWFHGQHSKARLHEDIETKRHVDKDGWWTITSTLKHSASHKPYTCSLLGKSGRYLRGALVSTPPRLTPQPSGGSLLTSAWSLLWVSIYLLLC